MPPFLLTPKFRPRGYDSPLLQSATYHGFGPHAATFTPRVQLKTPTVPDNTYEFQGRFLKHRATKNCADPVLFLTSFRSVADRLTIALPRQSLLHSAFFTGFQIAGMSPDFLDNVFLLDFAFEPAQSVFKRFALL
jgi:hypothetical protein